MATGCVAGRRGDGRHGTWLSAVWPAAAGCCLAVLAAVPVIGRARPAAAAAAPLPVIIDTDAGDDIDDAFALAVALTDPRLEVLGITTSWGDTRLRTLLVRRLLAALGHPDVAVAEGPATQSVARFTQRQWALGAADTAPAPDAIEFLRDQVRRRPGEITLIALAPLSTIHALQERDPTTLRRFKQVLIMAGSIHAGYDKGGAIPNPKPSAEYNVVSAPQGLTDLLGAGVPVRLFPLDSTQIKFDEVRRDRLFAFGSSTSDALTLLYHQWRLLNDWGQITPTLFDVVPVAWALQPALCTLEPLRIGVDPQGYTRTMAGAPNVSACLRGDAQAVQQVIAEHLMPVTATP